VVEVEVEVEVLPLLTQRAFHNAAAFLATSINVNVILRPMARKCGNYNKFSRIWPAVSVGRNYADTLPAFCRSKASCNCILPYWQRDGCLDPKYVVSGRIEID